MRTVIVGLLLTTSAVNSCVLEPAETLPFSNVEGSQFMRIGEPQTIVFRDESSWMAFWNSNIYAMDSVGNTIPPPSIDFSNEMVIAIFWGPGYGGCTNEADAIKAIESTQGRVVVYVGPVPYLGPCRAMQLPQQIVRLKRIVLPVVFTGEVPGKGR